MKLQTKYFGEVAYSEADVVHFPVGMLGFEDEHSFLLLPFAGSGGSMLSLQSTITPALAFVVLDPFSLHMHYDPVLKPEELRFFEVEDRGELSYYVLCVVKNPVSASTVNLKCPIVIHPETRKACQVIMDTDVYEMRHPLAAFDQSEEAGAC